MTMQTRQAGQSSHVTIRDRWSLAAMIHRLPSAALLPARPPASCAVPQVVAISLRMVISRMANTIGAAHHPELAVYTQASAHRYLPQAGLLE